MVFYLKFPDEIHIKLWSNQISSPKTIKPVHVPLTMFMCVRDFVQYEFTDGKIIKINKLKTTKEQ